MVTARARVRHADRATEASVELSPEAVEVRGELRLRIPLDRVSAVRVEGTVLRLESSRGLVEIEFADPAKALDWAHRIRHPRGLLEKLGVRNGMRVAVLGPFDPAARAALEAAAGLPATESVQADSDLIFLRAGSLGELDRLAAIRAAMKPVAAVWVVYPKGDPAMPGVGVIEAGLAAGLVDNKGVSFSASESGLRLVIRRSDRPKPA